MKCILISTFYILLILFLTTVFSKSSSRSNLTSLISCPKLSIKQGVVKHNRRNPGYVKIRCASTHFLIGHNYVRCMHGKWIGDIPKCVDKYPKCKQVKTIPNGLVFSYLKYNHAVVSFFCNPGYKLIGPDTIYCITENWDSNLPQCTKIDNTNPPTSCNFETEDLCGWTQDINHDFDWIRENNKTLTGHISTGPQFDHTFGSKGGGYFMHIDTQEGKPGAIARLFSPLYNIENYKCFEFYYKTLSDTLKVYIKPESVALEKIEPIFASTGFKAYDHWSRGFILLHNITEPFQIIFEGLRGPSFNKHVALDDVKLLTNCDSTSEPEMHTTEQSNTIPPNSYSEDDLTCFGRCNETESENHSSCKCFQNCYDTNSCCPDYIHYCVDRLDFTSDDVDSTTILMNEDKSHTVFIQSTPSTFPREATTLKKLSTTILFGKTILNNLKPTTVKSSTLMQTTKAKTIMPNIAMDYDVLTNKIETVVEDFQIPDEEGINEPNLGHIMIDHSVSNATKTIWPIVFLMLCVILVTVISGYTIYKYKRNERNNSNIEKATDVKFLTSDEILDFRLATPRDSDKLIDDSEMCL